MPDPTQPPLRVTALLGTAMLPGAAVLLGAAMLLSACGGGGVRGIQRQRIEVPSERTIDGWIRSDGELATRGEGPGVGDLATGQEVRLFYSFDLARVPPTSRIDEATLRFFQAFSVGTPFEFNPLLIESVDIGASLDPTDFSTSPIGTPASLRLNNLRIERRIDVTTLVQRDLDEGRTRSQFRLRFLSGTDGDRLSDFVAFETEDNDHGTGQRPSLEVIYERDP